MAQTIKLRRSATQGAVPTTSQLSLGEVAVNTYDGKMYIKKSVGGTESIVEIGAGGGLTSSFTLYEYTASASQTTFSGSDDNSNTLAYDTGTPPRVLVYLNGVLLDYTTDYTATSGTSVVLTSAAASGDLVQIGAYKSTVTSDQSIQLDDNLKLSLGDDSDLELWHTGSNSVIHNKTGQLRVRADDLSLQSYTNEELFITAVENGAVKLFYDNSLKLETTNDGITVTGDVEADEFIGDVRGAVLFKAQAGEALAKGDVVYISGISGNTTIVSKADADDASKMPAFGLVAAAASSGNPVDIYTNGILSGIDTSSYSEGDELFVSTTAGALTATAPTGESAALQKIGKVTRSASSGSIFIVGAGRTNAVPNLNEGKLFVGNSSNYAVADNTIHVDIANSVVGINKTNPSSAAALHVDGHIYVDTGDAIYADFFRPYSTTLATYGSSTNTKHYFLGNVGVGTNNPARRFEIHENTTNLTIGEKSGYTPSTYGPVFETNADALVLPQYAYLKGSQAYIRNESNLMRIHGDSGIKFSYYNGSTTTEGMRLDNSGRLGIGTASPSRKLDISAAGNDGIRIASANALIGGGGSGGDTQLIYWNGSNAYYGRSSLGGSVSNHYFRTGGTTRLSVTSSGISVAGSVGVTNIVTNKVVKFNGTILDDSNITDTGSLITLGSDTTISGAVSSGNITTSGTLDFTANPGYIRNDQDDSGQLILSVKNSSSNAQQVRWDAANASSGAWRPEVTNVSNLGLTNRIWNTLYVNNIRMGTANDQFVDANRNINVGNITATGFLRGPSTFTIDPAAHGDDTGTVVIAGNLQVDGTTTTINSTVVSIDDLNLLLAADATSGSQANGAGIIVNGPNNQAKLTYDATQDRWNMNKGLELLGAPLVVGTGSTDVGRVENSSGVFSLTAYTARQIAFGNDTNGEHVRIDANGNVGIGLTDPDQKLDVNGNIRIPNAGKIVFGSAGASPGDYLELNDVGSSGDLLKLVQDSTTRLAIQGVTGNVSIGVTTPFTVGGTAKLSLSTNTNVYLTAGASNSDLIYSRRLSSGHYQTQTYLSNNTGSLELQPYGGNVGIGTSATVSSTLQVEALGIDTTTTSTTATTQVAIDTFAAATFRSARYTIQVTNSTDSTYHITEILLIHDGTTPQITEYGTIFTGSAEATFDADISSGNVRLLATPATTDSMTFKVVRHCITV